MNGDIPVQAVNLGFVFHIKHIKIEKEIHSNPSYYNINTFNINNVYKILI